MRQSSSVRSAGSQLSRTSESKALGLDHYLHQAQNRGLGSGLFQWPNKATSVTKQMLVILRAPQQTEERLLCAIINLPKKPLAFSKVPPRMRSSFTPQFSSKPTKHGPSCGQGLKGPTGMAGEQPSRFRSAGHKHLPKSSLTGNDSQDNPGHQELS